jgi:hypothetical protein
MQKHKKGYLLPDDNHVIRYVSPNRLIKDDDGNVLGVFPQAFALRPNEEAPSVNWLEHFEGDYDARIKQTVHELRAAISVKGKSAFGVAVVGNIKEICKKNGTAVRIVYDPRKSIESHAEIRNFPRDDLSLLEDLANGALCQLIANADIE